MGLPVGAKLPLVELALRGAREVVDHRGIVSSAAHTLAHGETVTLQPVA